MKLRMHSVGDVFESGIDALSGDDRDAAKSNQAPFDRCDAAVEAGSNGEGSSAKVDAHVGSSFKHQANSPEGTDKAFNTAMKEASHPQQCAPAWVT